MTQDSTWTTNDGRRIKVGELSHQHISNILWYFELVMEMGTVHPVEVELCRRFGGIRLPYHPMISFTYEIDELVRKGYTTGELNTPITVNGRWVGTLKY